MGMSSKELQEAALEEAKKLNKSISDLSTDTKALTAYGHHNRYLIKWAFVSFVFNFIVCVVLACVLFKLNDAENKVEVTSSQLHVDKVAQYESCLSSNKARATQVSLWNNVFDTIGEARLPEIPDLRHQVGDSFVQRECNLP